MNDANCVELRDTLDQVRDSKNPTGPVLHADVPALLRAIRSGRTQVTPSGWAPALRVEVDALRVG